MFFQNLPLGFFSTLKLGIKPRLTFLGLQGKEDAFREMEIDGGIPPPTLEEEEEWRRG